MNWSLCLLQCEFAAGNQLEAAARLKCPGIFQFCYYVVISTEMPKLTFLLTKTRTQ